VNIGDKVYVVQVIGGHASINAGRVKILVALTHGSNKPDAAEIDYAPGHDSDVEWLTDVARTIEEARGILAARVASSIQGMRDDIAALEAINVSTCPVIDKTTT
jgi:hypothetical protein